MDYRYEHLTAAELRAIVIREMRKFTWALELGSTINNLEEIRNHIRSLGDMLIIKEKEEMKFVENIPQIKRVHNHKEFGIK